MIFQIRNTSSLPLEAGEVVLRVELDAHIAHMSSDLVLQLALLPPSSTVTITVPIVLRDDSLLFESYRWKAALILRTKCIEFCQDQIRMAPIYGFVVLLLCCLCFLISLLAPDLRNERHSADVLCFTSNLVTRAEFTSWNAVFADLGLSVDYWDIDKVGYILLLCFVIFLCFV